MTHTAEKDAAFRTAIGDCPVCERANVELTIKPPIRHDQPWRIACTDERACFRTHSAKILAAQARASATRVTPPGVGEVTP